MIIIQIINIKKKINDSQLEYIDVHYIKIVNIYHQYNYIQMISI